MTTLSLTAPQLAVLAREEGTILTVYDDATGLPIKKGSVVIGTPTIGTGRNLVTNGITAAENAEFLDHDCLTVIGALTPLAWWQALDPNRQFVCCDMAFQLGVSGFLSFRQMIAALTVSDWATAASQMANSLWAKQVPARCKELQNVILTGNLPSQA